MSIVKRFNQNYTVENTKADGRITLDSHEVYINGNLVVLGATTAVVTNNTSLTDNIITLNYGETGNGITLGSAGIVIDRGGSPNVAIIYDESVDSWQVTEDGINYINLVTSTSGLSTVEDDTSPTLGGNLDTNGYSISSSTGSLEISNTDVLLSGNTVEIAGNLVIKNSQGAANVIANSTILYANISSNAVSSGVYIVNEFAANQELITVRRAVAYSLLF